MRRAFITNKSLCNDLGACEWPKRKPATVYLIFCFVAIFSVSGVVLNNLDKMRES